VVDVVVSQDVLPQRSGTAIFLVATIDAGGESDVRDLLSDLSGLTRSVGFRIPERDLSCVVGIGSALWDRLFAGPRPPSLHPFRQIVGGRHTAVSTAGDLLFHLRAHEFDVCFELARQVTLRLAGRAQIVGEVHGFTYFDQRDLMGFVDGTENPTGTSAEAAAFVDASDPSFAGSSYVIVQKYVHDLEAWDALPVEQQERVIGRTKLSDIELPDEIKLSNSHVALNTIVDDDGVERQIVRENTAFGRLGVGEFGTYFIGYCADPSVTELMLRNMFIGKPVGNYDRILDFSTAMTGALFFVPSVDFLDDLPDSPTTIALGAP
jgi:putative iron-dependent peroxidase